MRIKIFSLLNQDPHDADNQGAKVKELQRMLLADKSVRGVWMDYLCVPQGEKDEHEQDFFNFTLTNIKMLYLSGKVAIFLDIQYMGRFWTQYEAFLALHKGTPEGIKPKTLEEVEESVVIIEMGAAAAAASGGQKQALIMMWLNKTVKEAVKVLKDPSVLVTKKIDKKLLLEKMPQLEKHVKELFLEIQRQYKAAREKEQRNAKEQVQKRANAEARVKYEAELRSAKEQDEKAAAEFQERLSKIEALLNKAQKEKEAAIAKEDYVRANDLKKELESLTTEKEQLCKKEEDRKSRRRLSLDGAGASSLSGSTGAATAAGGGGPLVSASKRAEAEIAGLKVKLKGDTDRLGELKLVPAERRDVKKIKSLIAEIAKAETDIAQKETELKQHKAAEKGDQEKKKKQKAEEEKARKLREQRERNAAEHEQKSRAADEKAFEQEKKALKSQMEAAGKADDYDELEKLQQKWNALPKTVDEWCVYAAEQRQQAAAETARREEADRKVAEEKAAAGRKAAEEKAAARRKAAEERSAAKAVSRQTMDRREEEWALQKR